MFKNYKLLYPSRQIRFLDVINLVIDLDPPPIYWTLS